MKSGAAWVFFVAPASCRLCVCPFVQCCHPERRTGIPNMRRCCAYWGGKREGFAFAFSGAPPSHFEGGPFVAGRKLSVSRLAVSLEALPAGFLPASDFQNFRGQNPGQPAER